MERTKEKLLHWWAFSKKKKIENQTKIAEYQSQVVTPTKTKLKNQKTAITRAALEYGAYEKVLYQS